MVIFVNFQFDNKEELFNCLQKYSSELVNGTSRISNAWNQAFLHVSIQIFLRILCFRPNSNKLTISLRFNSLHFFCAVHQVKSYRTCAYLSMVAYFCHHLSDNYVDLSDLYVVLSDLYVNLSDLYVNLSLISLLKNES